MIPLLSCRPRQKPLAIPVAFFLLALGPARARAATLRDVLVEADKVEIRLDGRAEYKTMALGSKLVVDLLDTKLGGPDKAVAGQGTYLGKVRTGQFQSAPQAIARVVLELKAPVENRIDREGDSLVVLLNPKAHAAAPAAMAAPVPMPAPLPAPVAAPAASPLSGADAPVTLLGIEVGPDVVGLRLSGSVEYQAKLASNPPRLEIVLAGTGSQVEEKSLVGMGKSLTRVTSRQSGSGARAATRVVLYLNKLAPYSVEKKEGLLHVLLNP